MKKGLKRKIAILLVFALILLPNGVYAAQESTDVGHLGGQDTSGINHWRIDADGDLIPGADSSRDIGETDSEVNAGYYDELVLGGVSKTSWGSVVTPWEDNGTTTVLTSNPTGVIITNATGDVNGTSLTAGTGDIVLENDQTIDGGTNNSIILGDNSDTLAIAFDGNDVSLTNSDGSIELVPETSAADGTVDIFAAGDTDDYVSFSTTTNQTTMNFAGQNGKITAASGSVDFDDEHLTTTSSVSVGYLTTSGTIHLASAERIYNSTDDTVTVKSNDTATVLEVVGYEATDSTLRIACDDGDDSADIWNIESDVTTNDLIFKNDTTTRLTLQDSAGLITTTGDVTVAGTTPKVTIGDGGTEDTTLLYNGIVDYYIANDDTSGTAEDMLEIGTGSAVGASVILEMSASKDLSASGVLSVSDTVFLIGTTPELVVGDNADEDGSIIFDNATQGYYIAKDDAGGTAPDVLTIGLGEVVGTTPIIDINGTTSLTLTGDVYVIGTTPVLTMGDSGAEDTQINFNSNALSMHIAMDDSVDDLVIGTGIVAGTTPGVTIDGADASVAIGTDAGAVYVGAGDLYVASDCEIEGDLSLDGNITISANMTVSAVGTESTTYFVLHDQHGNQYTVEAIRI